MLKKQVDKIVLVCRVNKTEARFFGRQNLVSTRVWPLAPNCNRTIMATMSEQDIYVLHAKEIPPCFAPSAPVNSLRVHPSHLSGTMHFFHEIPASFPWPWLFDRLFLMVVVSSHSHSADYSWWWWSLHPILIRPTIPGDGGLFIPFSFGRLSVVMVVSSYHSYS